MPASDHATGKSFARPIVNRPALADAKAARSRLTIGRRFPTCRNGPAAHKSVMKTNPLTVQITPSVRRCEKLARQAKPPTPPTLQTLAQQGRWGRRFRLPGHRNQFFTPRQRGDGFTGQTVPALTLGAISLRFR